MCNTLFPGDICISKISIRVWNSYSIWNSVVSFSLKENDTFIIVAIVIKTDVIEYFILTKFGCGWIDEFNHNDFRKLK